MANFNTSQSTEKHGNKSNGSFIKSGKGSGFSALSNEADNLLTPPQEFSSYEWSGVKQTIDNAQFTAEEIDKILTAYSKVCFRTRLTFEFIEFIDEQFPLIGLSAANSKQSYAVNLYLTICNFSAATYGEKTQKTLSYYWSDIPSKTGLFYINNPFGTMKNFVNVGLLELSLLRTSETYLTILTQTIFHYKGKTFQIDRARALELLSAVNEEMEKDIDVYFINAKARAMQILPDDVRNDERFINSMHDARWNEYDETIKREVAFYNQKFIGKGTNFVPLDWRYVKAMLWTEVYGPNIKGGYWQSLPMQIGRFAQDLGYEAVKNAGQGEGADLVVEDELKQKVQIKANVVGHLNVRAGIAYLYIRYVDIVKTEDEVVAPILTTTVLTGELGFETIARRLKTTTPNNIKLNNPEVDSKKL